MNHFNLFLKTLFMLKEESDTVLLDVKDQEILSGYYAINEGEDGKNQLQPIIKDFEYLDLGSDYFIQNKVGSENYIVHL